jgi:hypothetical protein
MPNREQRIGYLVPMGSVAAFIDSLNTGHWIAIAAIVIGSFFGSFTVANYLAGRRERKLKSYETTPDIKATINRKLYAGGWRSVQLHIIAPAEQQNFQTKNWRIDHARLLRPRTGAVLARAENDDYATGVFYPEIPLRELNGKVEGRPQRFALEFFIRFDEDDDRGTAAKFKVAYSHATKRRRHIVKVWATVPSDAERPVPARAHPLREPSGNLYKKCV